MKAEVTLNEKDNLIISWEKKNIGFGRLRIYWDKEVREYVIDSENMGLSFIIEVIQALPKDVLTR